MRHVFWCLLAAIAIPGRAGAQDPALVEALAPLLQAEDRREFDIATLQREAQLIQITQAGMRESHVHDVVITKEAPNYRVE